MIPMIPMTRKTQLLLTIAVLSIGCDLRLSGGDKECPACECACDCASVDAQPGADVGELAASANRRMHHGDGEGCLSDLDELAQTDPKLDERLSITRGQCEMLVGKCQEGKRRVAHWYEIETAMTAERAAITAEQLASMRCKGGDSSERDRLMAALFDLSDGAYMNPRDSEFCRERVEIARELLPRVKPLGPDDTQITGGKQALFYTAASCFARAGNCESAFAIYAELFPADGLSAIEDPQQRRRLIQQSFDEGIALCAPERP
jgi:hypothetical protein